MNFLRRIYLLLVSLLLIIVVTALLLSPETIISWVGSISEISSVIRILLAVVFGLLLLALMYVQIRPDRIRNMNGLMMRGSGAVTEVSVESARERILKAVSDVPDVISSEVDVKPINGKADIELQVVVYGHDVKLPVKQKEINRALKQVIDKQLGLRMAGQPRIHIRLQDRDISRPVVTIPPVTPLPSIQEEPVSFVTTTPMTSVVKETEPEVKQDSGGLFGGWRLGGKEDDESDEVAKEPLDKPVIVSGQASTQPAVDASRVVAEINEEDDLLVPSLSSLLAKSEISDGDSAIVELTSKSVIADVEDDKTLKLDLDEELAHSATDDFVDDELPDVEKSETNLDFDTGEKKEDHPPH
jgi:hypothetical protein